MVPERRFSQYVYATLMDKLRFLKQATESYALAIAFVPAAVSIVLLPVAFEAIQHVIEFRFGMFDSTDGIQSGKEDNVRLASGAVKLVSLIFVSVVVARYFLHDRDLQIALKFTAAAVRAALLSLALIAALLVLIFYGSPALGSWISSQELGVPDIVLKYLPLIVLIAVFAPLQRFALTVFAAMLDDTVVDFNSDKLVKEWTRQSSQVLLLTIGPAIVLHYYLNLTLSDKPLPLQIAVLTADSFLVGAMAVLMGTASWVSYRDAKLSQ